jgi:hypothetical protein
VDDYGIIDLLINISDPPFSTTMGVSVVPEPNYWLAAAFSAYWRCRSRKLR